MIARVFVSSIRLITFDFFLITWQRNLLYLEILLIFPLAVTLPMTYLCVREREASLLCQMKKPKLLRPVQNLLIDSCLFLSHVYLSHSIIFAKDDREVLSLPSGFPPHTKHCLIRRRRRQQRIQKANLYPIPLVQN